MTIGNKALLLLIATGLWAGPALADGSAPALMGVREIQVQHARLGNAEDTGKCGSSSGEIATAVLKILKADGLPAFSVMEAPAPRLGVARIDLIPEVVTLQRQSVDCTSWIALHAQTRSTVRIPPIETPRNVTVTYWRGGLLITSSQTAHPRALAEAINKLAAQFSKQYRLDQPPPLPDFGDPK